MDPNTTPRRIAIVTGASRARGIGAAVCKALAAEGIDIFFTYWAAFDRATYGAEEEPQALQQAIWKAGVRCVNLEIDQGRPQAAREIMDTVEEQLGSPTILVNNAAYSARGGYETIDAETIDAHYAVNIRGTLLLSAEFARRFQSTSDGHIVNLISGQAQPMPEELAYGASKGAIEAFTISLAAALASKRITVNAIDPGPTDTGWMTEEIKQQLTRISPQGRVGQPEDAARLITFLTSPNANWITGQVIHSRGGM
ncbi:SDR family oxidoreductase [Dictyobacter aurantiacus]|uniref:3-ketoacyl-ACP reductase n=1 Tax=Dictyobacter aurantiacus TaxID=1936993 RepID=A0A401ZRT7_9CHLR|nr:SDR family oxidoreductase [Dictyobacter aurantiacus]GCE09638.1 3-ketoacyl-ACP reductase [Dictyobacter aurantiacus]